MNNAVHQWTKKSQGHFVKFHACSSVTVLKRTKHIAKSLLHSSWRMLTLSNIRCLFIEIMPLKMVLMLIITKK